MARSKPLAIDLFCGLGGFTEGCLAEGFDVVGFDIERHVYGSQQYPAQLVLQDVLTIHGRQFKSADLIVASPPCQEYSYMAMPWSKAKQKRAEYLDGTRDKKQLTALFDACFRIQREACEASGRYIPLVVENVRGAQEWVGRSRFHFGSFHLWGDVPALMPLARAKAKRPGHSMNKGAPQWGPHHNTSEITGAEGLKNPGFRFDGSGKSFQSASVEHTKNNGGSWFNIGSPGQKETGRNPVHALASEHNAEGNKGFGAGLLGKNPMARKHGSKSAARKSASAMIAKIPLVLSRHIAHVYKPREVA